VPTGGTTGQVLTKTSATNYDAAWQTPSGGGLTKFTEAESTSAPNATVYVDSLTAAATSTNADVALVAKGTGATLAQVPDGTTAGGNKRGQYATDLQKFRVANSTVASGVYSTICGGQSNTASGSNSVAVGGREQAVSGADAAVVGGWGNTASSAYSFVGGGQSNAVQTNTHATVCGGSSNTASGQWSLIVGGTSNVASGDIAAIVGGEVNTASGANSFVGGGASNTADGAYSLIAGGRSGTTRSIQGYHVFPACSRPIAAVAGVTQSGLLLLGRQTTNATPTVLTSNTSAAGTTNQVILPNNSAYSFSGEVIAGVTGAGNTARWTINGAIKRGASAATTAMVGTPTVTMTHNDAGAAAWTVAVTADTTNGGISVTVTGAASTTIRWVAKLNTTEMSY
jgi:hypothetical protein